MAFDLRIPYNSESEPEPESEHESTRTSEGLALSGSPGASRTSRTSQPSAELMIPEAPGGISANVRLAKFAGQPNSIGSIYANFQLERDSKVWEGTLVYKGCGITQPEVINTETWLLGKAR